MLLRVVETPQPLPIPAPPPGKASRAIRDALRAGGHSPLLQAAIARERAPDIRAELKAVIREFYDTMERNAVAIKLLDRAVDHPEISKEWQTGVRLPARAGIETYLESRVRCGQLRAFPDTRLAARLLIETCATWAMHIKWDSVPQAFDAKAARDNVVDMLVRGLLADPVP